MTDSLRGLWIVLASIGIVSASAAGVAAQTDLKIMAPAAPGGGWDQTARAMQQTLVAAGLAKGVQVYNVAGAGGSVGIAQFVTTAKGDARQLMVNGFVMVGALLANKSPVTLDQTTPIARLTAETLVIVVPANSPIKTAQDLATAVKADVAKVTWAGGSAGGVDHITAALFVSKAGGDASKVNYIPAWAGAFQFQGRSSKHTSLPGGFVHNLHVNPQHELATRSWPRMRARLQRLGAPRSN